MLHQTATVRLRKRISPVQVHVPRVSGPSIDACLSVLQMCSGACRLR
jgi:hypothetical protein